MGCKGSPPSYFLLPWPALHHLWLFCWQLSVEENVNRCECFWKERECERVGGVCTFGDGLWGRKCFTAQKGHAQELMNLNSYWGAGPPPTRTHTRTHTHTPFSSLQIGNNSVSQEEIFCQKEWFSPASDSLLRPLRSENVKLKVSMSLILSHWILQCRHNCMRPDCNFHLMPKRSNQIT